MVPTEEITGKRLQGWAKRLSEEHSTPLVMIGLGHDQARTLPQHHGEQKVCRVNQ